MAFPFNRRTVPVAPATVETMQDLWDFLTVEGPEYLLQAMRTLATHTNHAPPSSQDATYEWIAAHFPKSRNGVHPRPELNQNLAAYMKWRADLVRAVAIATGARSARQARDARQDGWTDLLSAIRLHSKDGGLIHPAAASLMTTFTDIGRRASLEPWDLAKQDAVSRLEAALPVKVDRKILRRGLAFLSTYGFIPEIGAVLPEGPLPALPELRMRDALPRISTLFSSQWQTRPPPSAMKSPGKTIRASATPRVRPSASPGSTRPTLGLMKSASLPVCYARRSRRT